MEVFFGIVLAALLWLNGAASYHLLRSPIYERQQKLWQLLIIWLVPFVGAVVVLTVMAGGPKQPEPQTERTGVLATVISALALSALIAPRSNGHDGTDGGTSDFGDAGSGDGGQ